MIRTLLAFALFLSFSAVAGSWFFIGTNGSGATVILLDNFVDTNGTALESHTMDVGPGWVKDSSSAEIQSNLLVGVSGQTDPLYVSNAPVAVGTLTAAINLNVTDSQVNLYLGTNVSGGAAAGYIVICYPVAGMIQIFRSGEGVGGVVAQETVSFSSGVQNWKAVLTATNLTFFIDGSQKITATVNAVSGTYFGWEMFHPAATPLTTWSQFKLTDE